MNEVYKIENLVKIYPGSTRRANDNLSFQVNEGEIFGILGDNGAGKSTLVRQMANLVSSTSGEIRLFDSVLGKTSLSVPSLVGYMPQDGSALNHLTVGEAIYFTAHLRGMSSRQARQERDQLLEELRVEYLRDKDSSTLSGGERRLLRLAIAMAGAPPVLLLDEPTNDLDPLRRKQVWDIIRDISKTRNTTVIFVTHDATEAEKVIERIAILHQGRLLAIGRLADLKQKLGSYVRMQITHAPGQGPELPPDVQIEQRSPDTVVAVANLQTALAMLGKLSGKEILDLRVNTCTLEDLYLHYVDPA